MATTKKSEPLTLTPQGIRALAVASETAPATCRRLIEGLVVRPLSRTRIERAAAALGIDLAAMKVRR